MFPYCCLLIICIKCHNVQFSRCIASAQASYRSPPGMPADSFISLRFLSLYDRSLCSPGHVAGFGCSLFRSHPELSLNEALNFLRTSVNKSPRLPNRSPAQRVRFGEAEGANEMEVLRASHSVKPKCSWLLLTKWWAKVDSNHRPHDYQSCALAS